MADTDQEIANHTLAMLQGLRRELAAVLDNQARDRELLHRLQERVQAGFEGVSADLREIRGDIAALDIKSVTYKNDILAVLRRLDQVAPLSDTRT